MGRRAFFTACLLLPTTVAANAADWSTVPLRPSVDPQDGFTIGLIGGYGSGRARFDFPDAYFFLEDKPSGYEGGIIAGYEFHQDGYFSAFEVVGMIGGVSRTYTIPPIEVSYGIEGHVDARVRAGFMTGGIALSAIGGVTYNNVAFNYRDNIGWASGSDWQWGWLAGAAVDMPITDRISVGAEYTYNALIDRTYYGGLVTIGGSYHAARLATRLKI